MESNYIIEPIIIYLRKNNIFILHFNVYCDFRGIEHRNEQKKFLLLSTTPINILPYLTTSL